MDDTMEQIADALRTELIGYHIVRGDESLCVRDGNGPLAMIELENDESDEQFAIINFATSTSPHEAALIAVTLDNLIYTVIDTEMFESYRSGATA